MSQSIVLLTNSKICTSSLIQLQRANIVAIKKLINVSILPSPLQNRRHRAGSEPLRLPERRSRASSRRPAAFYRNNTSCSRLLLGEPAVRCHTRKQVQVKNRELRPKITMPIEANKMSDFVSGWFVVTLARCVDRGVSSLRIAFGLPG